MFYLPAASPAAAAHGSARDPVLRRAQRIRAAAADGAQSDVTDRRAARDDRRLEDGAVGEAAGAGDERQHARERECACASRDRQLFDAV